MFGQHAQAIETIDVQPTVSSAYCRATFASVTLTLIWFEWPGSWEYLFGEALMTSRWMLACHGKRLARSVVSGE